ncbi:MAG: hypothetical protein DRI56_12950 [Chloroflexota bacterium]|nr:MAG: hypothetical protein DRI56_12950 [Chloroflexota bacterium]
MLILKIQMRPNSPKNLMNYLKERFPIIPLLLFCGATLCGIASGISSTPRLDKVITLTLVYLGFLLHLRILDELKDLNYDQKFHSERPIPKGLVTLTFLKKVDLINLVLLLTATFCSSTLNIFFLFLVSLLYTGLMFKEFFLPTLRETSVPLYLVLHQSVFIFLYLFFFSTLSESFWSITSTHKLAHFLYMLIPPYLIEIGRKVEDRISPKGEKTNDTYTYLWGQKKTIHIFACLIFISGLTSLGILNFPTFLSAILIVLSLLLFIGSCFASKLIAQHSMLITVLLALILPLLPAAIYLPN